MDFDQAREAFFQPREGADAPAAATSTDALRLRHALEPLAMVHIWSGPAHARLADAGLNFLTGYVGGRAAPLGDVAPTVVASAFAVFEPGLVGDLWTQARAVLGVAELRALREVCAAEALRDALADVDVADVERVTTTLRTALDLAAGTDLAGRPMFAALRGLPWPEDPHAALWHAASLYREHRGDGHLAACTAADVDGLEANVLTELRVGFGLLEYTGSRGWSPEAMDAAVARLTERGWVADAALTGAGRAAREAIEAATDVSQQRLVAALGPDLTEVVGTADAWADRVVARDWFPPDPYKRAAG